VPDTQHVILSNASLSLSPVHGDAKTARLKVRSLDMSPLPRLRDVSATPVPEDSAPGTRPAPPALEDASYRALVQGVSDYAILMLDREGFVRSWNAGAERIKATRPTRSSASISPSSIRRRRSTAAGPDHELRVAAEKGPLRGRRLARARRRHAVLGERRH
jgi:hypothetical protein